MTTSTPLRQRLIEDMQLHGFAAKTQDAYVRAHFCGNWTAGQAGGSQFRTGGSPLGCAGPRDPLEHPVHVSRAAFALIVDRRTRAIIRSADGPPLDLAFPVAFPHASHYNHRNPLHVRSAAMPNPDDDLSKQASQLQQLYQQGLLSEANFRVALMGLNLNTDESRTIERQIIVQGSYYDQRKAAERPVSSLTLDEFAELGYAVVRSPGICLREVDA